MFKISCANQWRIVTGVICDRISAKIKAKAGKNVVRSATMYQLKSVPPTKRQKTELDVTELKMLRFSIEATKMDQTKNKCIRGTTVECNKSE